MSSFDEVRAALEPLGDAARAQAMSAYMRGRFAFLGVPTPARRAAVRTILARRPLDWPLVWDCWDADAREYQYVAADHVRRQRYFPAAQLDSLRQLLVTKSWWDSADSLAKVAGTALAVEPNAAGEVLTRWQTDPNFWVRRVAIICQLGFGTATDRSRLSTAIAANLGTEFASTDEKFFITKAIGWALRDFARHDPDWVRAFVADHDLAPLSRREALKHLG